MQKITTHLWFDKEAKEAAEFYTSVFENAKIKGTTTLHNHLYRFLSPVKRRTRSMRYGKNSQKEVRHSWS